MAASTTSSAHAITKKLVNTPLSNRPFLVQYYVYSQILHADTNKGNDISKIQMN